MTLQSFCSLEAVFASVLLAELLAIVITLAESTALSGMLLALALNSLFVLWVTLASCALLCTLQRRLRRQTPAVSLSLAYLGILAVAWLLSEIAWELAGDRAAVGQVLAGSRAHFLIRNLGLTSIIAAISLRYLYLQEAWRQRMLSESAARISALQARIRPHFLFNSLNTIAALVPIDPVAAERAIEDLSDLFRASLKEADGRVLLADEFALCERYLAMEALRLGPRLGVEWQVDALPRDFTIPSLLLQPLVENAVYHGIEPLPEGGVVRISGGLEGTRLRLVIDNPCSLTPRNGGPRPHHGMALQNIRERIQAHYGDSARLTVAAQPGHFRVELDLPQQPEHADAHPHR